MNKMHRNLIHFFHPFFIKRPIPLISWSRDVIILTVSRTFIYRMVIQQHSFFLYFYSSLFFPFPKGSQLVLYPSNNKPQTNIEIHNQTKKKGWAYSESLLNGLDQSIFPPSFFLHFSPQLYKNKTHKTNETKTNKPQCNKHMHPSINHFCAQISTEDIYPWVVSV